MKKRISILGCGWLGKALAHELVKKGCEIKGSTTSKDKLLNLELIDVIPFVIDIGKRNSSLSDFLSSEILIIAITSKNVDDFKNLINNIEESNLKKVLFISSTSVYPNTNQIATENSAVKETLLSEIEKLFTSNVNFEATIVRFGGLFGYDRKPGNFVRPGKKMENPDGYINLIHRDDCIDIIEKIITYDIWNETLNACTDTHPKRREFYTKETIKIGKPKPVFNETSPSEYKIVNNEKLKAILDFSFKYSNLMDY